jgi:hypothetical protein
VELADEREPPEVLPREPPELAELLPREPPELAELLDPLTWLPEELLEELLDTLVELELGELDPLAPDVCCDKRVAGTKRTAAMTRPENRIKHLPTDSSLTLLRCGRTS